jgi:hypothetical protein
MYVWTWKRREGAEKEIELKKGGVNKIFFVPAFIRQNGLVICYHTRAHAPCVSCPRPSFVQRLTRDSFHYGSVFHRLIREAHAHQSAFARLMFPQASHALLPSSRRCRRRRRRHPSALG